MDAIKAISSTGSKRDYWMNYDSNRQRKQAAHRRARRKLKVFAEILKKELDKQDSL